MPNVVATPHGLVAACLPALAVAGLTLPFAAPRSAHAASAATVLDVEERTLCRQINRLRSHAGAPPLRLSPRLTKASRWHSSDMARHDRFSHLDSRGRDFDARIMSFGYSGPTMAENLAAGEGRGQDIFRVLKSSPAHRRNMLRPQLKVIGVGRAYGAATWFGWYWSTTFGGTVDTTAAC
ncbi:MAG: CAP domain-containing protein [Solirubrobacteraceae bacterium]|nr:CAP domain-containing protein [Solirubrobacteraceae bacterium]